jgi:hypothetical protein
MKKLVGLLSLCCAQPGPANASPQVTTRYPVWGNLNGLFGLPRSRSAAAFLNLVQPINSKKHDHHLMIWVSALFEFYFANDHTKN